MAQRMESVAPPGGVMLSESTARLVEHTVMLGEPEQVRIKGAEEPVRRAPAGGDRPAGRRRSGAPRRAWSVGAGRWRPSTPLLDRAIDGRGGVVNVVGPPGIGKSRVAREVAAAGGRSRGRGVLGLLRVARPRRPVPCGDAAAARGPPASTTSTARPPAPGCGNEFPDADAQDLLLLDDLLGIADPDVALPAIDPDARRRRLTALVNTASLARNNTGAVHHRGCALDRCGQRVDAGRLPVRDSAHPVDGADHLPPRISRGR